MVAVCAVKAQFKNQSDVNISHYRIDGSTQRQAFSSISIYGLVALIGTFILCGHGIDLTRAAYECLSAIGTVGLSTGITPTLPAVCKITIILLMYLGRVGSLTVFMAVSRKGSSSKLRQPVGNITVG